ncbi:MAG: cytochrome c maturation protein CcmE [Gammaproteobacteria bacterium]|nr:cytochrome c maturation protein CcmE [Gammaproteobacteria bacterium]
MTPRRWKRFAWVAAAVVAVAIAVWFATIAFRDNLLYYFTPTELMADDKRGDRSVRIGGFVKPGSLRRDAVGLGVSFVVTDHNIDIDVFYEGVLPDLFREGQGVIVVGHWLPPLFTADEVLAKHDENYKPPGLDDAYQSTHQPTPKPAGSGYDDL